MPAAPALRLIVMGPSGCGKSTLARALAQSLDYQFLEGDELHPLANVGKMRSGVPLDDADRGPWLDAVAAALANAPARGVVATCSALKRCYRDRLQAAGGPLHFIHPCLPREALAQRLAVRTGHFMPAALLDSQLADLEPLGQDEAGLTIEGAASVRSQVDFIRSRLGL
jgi:gluconokinase